MLDAAVPLFPMTVTAGRAQPALIVVRRDMTFHTAFGAVVLDIVGKDRNPGIVGFADRRPHGFGIARIEDNCRHTFDDEVFNLSSLPIDVLITGDNHDFVAVLLRFFRHGVSNDLKKGIGKCEG